ncbi:flagellar export chaperone FliS [Angustibacter luteus]|uniref:Flagellar export chaperone FliS n=1 Tax=Angustibacter luteus TaxID=658456 RepID=A0ABW1JHE8_9ACTN
MTFPMAQNQAYQRAAGRYGSDTTATASPARLLVMLYDRLSLDLTRAHQAQLDGDREVANDNIAHAQDIIAELLTSLDVDAWEGGHNLASLYRWLIRELIAANTRMDATRTAGCITVVEPLRQAWTEAMTMAASPTAGTPLLGASA